MNIITEILIDCHKNVIVFSLLSEPLLRFVSSITIGRYDIAENRKLC